MLPLQGTTHHPPHRAPEAARPLHHEADSASNQESERYAGFDLLLTQAVDDLPRERRTRKRKGK